MPFVPEVIEDESLVSYLYRFSLANHHEISWQAEELSKCNEEIKAVLQKAVGYYMNDVMQKLHIGEKKMRR